MYTSHRGQIGLNTPAKNSLIVDFSIDLNRHAFHVVARKAEFARNGWAECVIVIEGSVGHVGFRGE